MEFNDKIRAFAERIETIKGTISTEEGTKMSLIVPLFQILGYDVFNPLEFCPEYTADVGIKKGEKVDYAIIENNIPNILIECKSCNEILDKHASQLFRYFGTTEAKFGILTNGIIYRFYTDLEQANKMDIVPFLEIDITNIKDTEINELKKFSKGTFDKDKIFSTAEELKYSSLVKTYLSTQFENPSDDFIKLITNNIYDGVKTQKVIEKFIPIIKRSLAGFINDSVNQKITSALTKENTVETDYIEPVEETISKIQTTEMELEAFYIIKGILTEICQVEDISYRDTESYFSVLYKNNNRKPICRLFLNERTKQILLPDADKKFNRNSLETLNDIYKFKTELLDIAKRYVEVID